MSSALGTLWIINQIYPKRFVLFKYVGDTKST
jgi:hypothetical protein